MREKEITKIKHFHPKGEEEPNGHNLQKGGYFKECSDNLQKFDKETPTYIFPSEITEIQGEPFLSHNFKGTYIDKKGNVFNENSFTKALIQTDSKHFYTYLEKAFLQEGLKLCNHFGLNGILAYWSETKDIYSIIPK